MNGSDLVGRFVFQKLKLVGIKNSLAIYRVETFIKSQPDVGLKQLGKNLKRDNLRCLKITSNRPGIMRARKLLSRFEFGVFPNRVRVLCTAYGGVFSLYRSGPMRYCR